MRRIDVFGIVWWLNAVAIISNLLVLYFVYARIPPGGLLTFSMACIAVFTGHLVYLLVKHRRYAPWKKLNG